MNSVAAERPTADLVRENAELREEVRVARRASDITAQLVAEQFARIEEILLKFEEKAQAEQKLGRELAKKLREAETREGELAGEGESNPPLLVSGRADAAAREAASEMAAYLTANPEVPRYDAAYTAAMHRDWHPFRVIAFADGITGVKKAIIDWYIAGSRAGAICPPSVLGVGIGGTADISTHLAKEAAALRLIGSHHPEPQIAELEEDLASAINQLGIGPMGSGGATSVLAVNVEYSLTHLAGIARRAPYFSCLSKKSKQKKTPQCLHPMIGCPHCTLFLTCGLWRFPHAR